MEKSNWEIWVIKEQYILSQYLISHIFPPTVCTVFYILFQTEEINHYQYKYIF